MIHSHSDRKIKTCAICQASIKEIREAGRKLDKLGIWDIPNDVMRRLRRGEELTIWSKRKYV